MLGIIRGIGEGSLVNIKYPNILALDGQLEALSV